MAKTPWAPAMCPDCSHKDGEWHLCPTHWIATVDLQMGLHFEGHEDCCDVPLMKGLVKQWDEDTVRRAITVLSPKSKQPYARSVLELAVKEGRRT